MSWRMAGRRFDDHHPISKDIEVLIVEDLGLGVPESAVMRQRAAWYFFVEHRVSFSLLHDPGCPGEIIGVCNVVKVIVRKHEVSDIRRLVTCKFKLRFERLCRD